MKAGLQTAIIASVSGLFGVLVGAWLDYSVREREIDVKMIEIAVGLLKENPKGPLQPARRWAVELIDHYSDVKLHDEARAVLLNCPLDLTDRLSALGTTVPGKGAVGRELPGSELCSSQ